MRAQIARIVLQLTIPFLRDVVSDMSPREMLHGTMEGHIGDSILNLACLNQGKEQIGQADVILVLIKKQAYLFLLDGNVTYKDFVQSSD